MKSLSMAVHMACWLSGRVQVALAAYWESLFQMTTLLAG
jgi:hypothetical protein